MIVGIELHLEEKWNQEFSFNEFDSFNLAYNNYVNWEKSGGKELQLPGFFLTNRQMFWVAHAHRLYQKIQPSLPLAHQMVNRITFLIDFYLNENFRADFNCSQNTTELDDELIMLINKGNYLSFQ